MKLTAEALRLTSEMMKTLSPQPRAIPPADADLPLVRSAVTQAVRRLGFYLFILQLITVTCAAEGESVIPQKLEVYVGSSIFGAWHVVLHGQTLTCRKEQSGREDQNSLPVTPTVEQWRDFRQAMDKLAVWRWQRDYPNRDIADGTQWRVDIVYADRAVSSEGSNNFPGPDGKPNSAPYQTEAFRAFIGAFEKLLGKKRVFPDVG